MVLVAARRSLQVILSQRMAPVVRFMLLVAMQKLAAVPVYWVELARVAQAAVWRWLVARAPGQLMLVAVCVLLVVRLSDPTQLVARCQSTAESAIQRQVVTCP